MIGTAFGAAQTTPKDEGFTEEVSVGYVLVPVLVRTPNGGYAKNLDKEDFRLLVDGRPAPFESFEARADAPASLLFLQDLSGSMANAGKINLSRDVVRYFLGRGVQGDEFAIAGFAGDQVQMQVPFTADLAVLRQKVSSWEPYGTTALHDALSWIPDFSQTGHNPKRFAILITDGIDNASSLQPARARELVRAAQVPVYVIGLSSGDPYTIGPDGKKPYKYADVLNLLAHETGGRYYSLDNPEGLSAILAAITEDFHHQYVLGFSTGEGKARYRNLRVEVPGRNRSVLFRRGYTGPPPSPPGRSGP
jgi:Ca-activated chloride channel family protein